MLRHIYTSREDGPKKYHVLLSRMYQKVRFPAESIEDEQTFSRMDLDNMAIGDEAGESGGPVLVEFVRNHFLKKGLKKSTGIIYIGAHLFFLMSYEEDEGAAVPVNVDPTAVKAHVSLAQTLSNELGIPNLSTLISHFLLEQQQ
ncbi:hypothetical protein V8E55_010200 [Tylopilus felleus]